MFAQRTQWNLAVNRFSRAIEEHRAAKRELLDLSASNPTAVGLNMDAGQILDAFQEPRALEYHPDPKGMLLAREAVAEYYRERDGGKSALDPEKIILTTSTSEGYSFVFRLLCNPGDEVLVPQPSYPLFEFLADLQDVRLVPYTLFYDHGWHVDWTSVDSAVNARTRAIIVVHPNNPTGSYIHQPEFETLNALCLQRNLALIADEVFFDYEHLPGTKVSFAHNQGALTFTLSGISKISCLPQMKLAWIVAGGPAQLVHEAGRRLEVIADTYLSMNAVVQLAAPVLLEQRRRVQPQLAARIRENLQELDTQIARQSMASRLQIEAGWYAILRVPAVRSDEDLAIQLLQSRSVLAHPGHFYDFPGEGHLVLSLITPQPEFAEGVRRILAEITAISA
ncbi:MAG TPA: pyridoxal phosphate-dependent aminotransferase [Terriglobales bacterium]|jgi:alanine-synthesizing transaminase|nr:pyridoxal phosphate-dependent aminotransferase [Terriglobales bacterium]